MELVFVEREEINLVGISVRAGYQYSGKNCRIFPCAQRYFLEALSEIIPHRKNPGVTFCAYTDYESDFRGDYTYFIGEAVSSQEGSLPDGLRRLTIPRQFYAKFTTPPAPMPQVVQEAWKEIWEMSTEDLGGKRNYHTDFEVFDERAANYQKVILDLYVGIEPNREGREDIRHSISGNKTPAP